MMGTFLRRYGIALAFYFYNHIIGRLPGYRFRTLYLKFVFGLQIGSGTAIHMNCFFTGRNIKIGERTVLNRRCYLDGRGGLVIGSDVSISPECYILTLTHDPQALDFAAVPKPVEIASRAWLGARTIVLPGVHIGEGAVIGAGAVVTRDVEPYDIVAGNPARKIGERNRSINYEISYFPFLDTDITP